MHSTAQEQIPTMAGSSPKHRLTQEKSIVAMPISVR